MNIKEAFESQIENKPESDTFTVYAVDEEKKVAGEGGLLKFAVDYNKLDEFHERIGSKYDCIEFHEDTTIPVLREK